MNKMNFERLVLREVSRSFDNILRERRKVFVNEGMNYDEISTKEPIEGHKAAEIANEVAAKINKEVEGVEKVSIGNRLISMQDRMVDSIKLFVEMEYDDTATSGADMKEIQQLADFIRSNYGEVEMHTGNGKDKTLINFPYEYEEDGHTKHAEIILQVTTDAEWSDMSSRQSMFSDFDSDIKKILLVKIAELTPYQGEDGDKYKNDDMYDGEYADVPRSKWAYDFGYDALYWRNRARAGKNKPLTRKSAYLEKEYPRFDGNVPGSRTKVLGKRNLFGKEVDSPLKLSQAVKLLLGDEATMSTINSAENIIKFLHSDKYKFAGDEEMLNNIKEGVIFILEKDGKMDEIEQFQEMWDNASLGDQVNEMRNLFGRMMLY